MLNTARVARYLSVLAEEHLDRVPHGDTVSDVLKVLLFEELGRLRTQLVRWLIEAYCQHPQAAKNFYLLLQIAHILAQLFQCRMGGKQAVVARWGSLKELADDLKRSLLADDLPAGDQLRTYLETPIQVRLDTS